MKLWFACDSSGDPSSYAVGQGDVELATGLTHEGAKRIVLSHNLMLGMSLDTLELVYATAESELVGLPEYNAVHFPSEEEQ